MKKETLLAYIAFGVVCVVWGTTYLAIRVTVQTVPPLMLTGTRYMVAGLIMLGVLKLRGEKLPREIAFNTGWCTNGETMRDDAGTFRFWGKNKPDVVNAQWEFLHFEKVVVAR